MKLKRTFKTLLMIIATVMSVVSGILIDSGTLAYAATTYTLTLNWDDGVEWVATDKDGIYRWEKGGSKTFQAGSKAYTYVKLKNDATVKSFFSRQENKDWTDYTYTSGSLCYDTWTMYNNRNVDIYTSVSSSADVSYDWDNLVTSSKHYHSSNGNEASWSNLRDDLGRSPAPIYSIYYKLQENRYRETCYGDNQEDKDFGGYEIMLRTEDSYNSYWYGQSSYANGDRFDDWYRDEFEGIKLSNLAIVPVQIKGDKFLQINISIKNTNSYAKEISLATCSDIQVADDDNATTFFNGNGFTMTNMYCETSDNYHGGTVPTATLNVYAKDVPGYVTDADAVYIGHFVYRKQHIWSNNVLGDKTTYFNKKPHGGTSGEGESDSGFSIAWKNRTIAAGQTQTYSYIIGIGKYNSDNKITFDANGGELKTPGENINKPNGNNSNNVTVTYGTASYSSMSGDIPERAGYTFDGWWTTPNDSSAGVMVYDASGKCNNDCNYWKNNQWQGTNDLTVYAHWKANTYTVRLNTGDIPSSELTELTETASTEGWTWNENGRYFSKAFIQNENNYLPGVNKFFSANNYESVGSKVTDKYFVQDKTKNPTKVLYNWWTSASGGTDIGRGKKIYNNLYEISKDNSGIVNLYPHWMGYTTVFNYTATAPSNTAGQIVTINNNINDGMDNNLYQVYGNCFFYKGTDGEYHDYEGTNPDLKVTASIPDSNGYKYIFNGWHHKNWNYLTDGLGKLTYKNNYNIGQGKTSYSLSPHFSRVGINYNVRLNANVPENTESTLQVLHQNGISSYIYNSTSRYFSRELTYDDSQDMLSPDVYSLKGYHLINRSNWYTEKTGGNTVSAPCNNTEAEYPDWAESNWNLTTEDGATVDLYARWQANNYKIAYNLDGGTYGTSHPTSADYDTMVTIDNPSKSGYTFTGWTITGYDPNTSGHNASAWTGETGTSYKNLTATDGATVTFTATWSKEAPKTARYTVKHYQMNTDGTYPSTPTNTESFSGLIGSSVTPAVKDYGQIFDKPSTKTVTISADGNTTVEYKYPRKKARVIVGKSTGIKTTDPVPGDYANGYIGQTVTLSAIPETGYRFKNWTSLLKENYGTVFSTTAGFNYTLTYNDSTAIQHQYGNGTSTMWGAYMQANAEPITYNIKYNYNGGIKGVFAPSSAKYNEDVKISNPTKKNYIFAGWTITGYDPNTSGHSAVAWTGETGASFKNLASTEGKTVTFTATWVQKNVHLVTISGRGIKLSKPLSYDGHVGETKRITAELKPGYRFVNWTNYYNANEVISTDKDFDYKITDKDYDNSLSNKGGTYLKSNAVPIDYTITYKLNGGTASNPASYNVESNTFTLNNPTRAGYTFAGWCESKDTSYVYNRNANEVIKKDESDSTSCFIPECHASLDYAPVFDPAYYLAKYPDLKSAYGDDANKALSHFVKYGMKEGRQGSAEFEVNAYKAKYKDLKDAFGDNLQKYYIHYILAGKSEGRTISQASVSIYQGSTGNRTYTATWTPINYTISYDLNGGAVAISNPTSYNVETPTFTLNNPVKLGYVFVGWTGSNGITPQKSVSIYKGSTGNKSYKANWTAADIGYTVNHYVMDINGNYPSTPTKAERLSGFTDTSVTAKRLNFGNGFTYPDVQTVKVKADGTTVVNYYYARNKYTLDLNGFISSVSRPNLTEEVDGQIFIAGKATVTVNGKVLATNETDFCQMVYYGSSYKITTVPEAGYSIIGNTTVEGTMPASDKTVTITINANKDTKYIVRHWKEKLYLDGTKTYADSSKHNTTNYFLADTDNLTGQTNRLVTPTVKTYEGFTSPSTITVRVKGDGSLIVDYYYTRNTYTLKTDDSNSNKDDQDNGIKSGNGIDSSKTNVISEGNNKKDNKKKFKYEEVVTVTTDTLSGYHWHVNDDCETIKRNLYPTGWSDHEGYRVEKWYTENGKTYGYKDQTTKFYMPAHDVKLDVNATNNSYKIIFEKNKPINVTNPYTGAVSSASSEITGTVVDTFYIYNHANQKLPGNVYNLTGWTFKGWSLKKDYSNGYNFGWEYGTNSWNNDLSHLTTKNLDVIYMYAKWEANRYQIAFNYGHDSSNPYGNLGYDEKAEAATKLTKNGPDSKIATYDAKVGALPNPTLTGATFVKWVDSKGNEYTQDTIYKITSPITLYAVWQQNTGTFAYIANGITYNNNGIGVYEATNSDGTNQFKAMTEDITLEENKFGTTMENTSYSNFTKKSKYGYVVINAGTSYAKETDTSGDSVYYSFQGWSANNYATVAGDKNAGLIHQVGYKDRLFNYAYETMANEMNTLGTGYNSKDTSVADSIRAKANELYNTKELTQNNTYAIMYAVWDQFPVIKSDQVVLTINDFSAYVNENANGFEQHAYDVIKDKIINANTVKDREDGNIRDNIEIENLDEILNMMLAMYKTPGMTSSMVTIRTHVSDSVGNTTYGYTTVALINNKAKQDDPIIPTVDEDGKEINTRILSAKVRSITREFYNTGYEGSSDYKSDYSAATYKNYGGLIPNSIWYKNEEYVKTINQCFDNFDNNTPEQTWYFTHDDVLSIQEYAKQHKDTPHGVEDGELTNFYNKYKSCIIQGTDAS